MLGDGRVGKTSILNKYINDSFSDSQVSTVNCSYFQKDVEVHNQKFSMCLWDTAGQERFNALASIYYKEAKGAILVYDITIKESFLKVDKWRQELQIFNDGVVVIVAGNKSDLIENIDVDPKIINNYCSSYNIDHIYTSAKTGKGLDEVFNLMAQRLADPIENEDLGSRKKSKFKLTVENQSISESRACC